MGRIVSAVVTRIATVIGLSIVLHIVVVVCCRISTISVMVSVGVVTRVGMITGVDVWTITVVVVARTDRTVIVVDTGGGVCHQVGGATITPAELDRLEVLECGERIELAAIAVVRHYHVIVVRIDPV